MKLDKQNESVTEKSWISNGLQCRVILVNHSHRCGYVGLPKDHICFKMGYDDVPVLMAIFELVKNDLKERKSKKYV